VPAADAATAAARRSARTTLWIAATALAHGLGNATHNTTHFQRIDGLRIVTTTA